MNKYYYVPVTSRHIKYDDKSLLDVTGVIDPLLKERELERVKMIDNVNREFDMSRYNFFTSSLYKGSGIPERLILVQSSDGLKELLTLNDVTVIDNYLHCFEVSACEVDYILENSDYFNESSNYFYLYNYRKSKSEKKL